jgi:hypothetical protein
LNSRLVALNGAADFWPGESSHAPNKQFVALKFSRLFGKNTLERRVSVCCLSAFPDVDQSETLRAGSLATLVKAWGFGMMPFKCSAPYFFRCAVAVRRYPFQYGFNAA